MYKRQILTYYEANRDVGPHDFASWLQTGTSKSRSSTRKKFSESTLVDGGWSVTSSSTSYSDEGSEEEDGGLSAQRPSRRLQGLLSDVRGEFDHVAEGSILNLSPEHNPVTIWGTGAENITAESLYAIQHP